MRNFIFEYEDFKNNFQTIFEDSSNAVIDVPGHYKTGIQIIGNKVNISTSKGRIYSFDVADFVEYKSDASNLNQMFLDAMHNLFQDGFNVKTSNDVRAKLKYVKQAESFELFDVSAEGFFKNMNHDLVSFGVDAGDIITLQNRLPKIFDENNLDSINPTAISHLIVYLNDIIELICAKIFFFFKFAGRESIILQPTQGANLDYSEVEDEDGESPKEENTEKFMAFDGGIMATNVDDYPNPKSDYQSRINDITHITNSAVLPLGLGLSNPYDYKTGREVSATTIYIAFDVLDKEISIISILSLVEMKKKKFDIYPFWVCAGGDNFADNYPVFSIAEITEELEEII